MNIMHTYCARVALSAAAVAVSGCASEPIAAGASLVGGFFSATVDVAIVTGRTLTNAAGLGTDPAPPRAAGPVQPLLPK